MFSQDENYYANLANVAEVPQTDTRRNPRLSNVGDELSNRLDAQAAVQNYNKYDNEQRENYSYRDRSRSNTTNPETPYSKRLNTTGYTPEDAYKQKQPDCQNKSYQPVNYSKSPVENKLEAHHNTHPEDHFEKYQPQPVRHSVVDNNVPVDRSMHNRSLANTDDNKHPYDNHINTIPYNAIDGDPIKYVNHPNFNNHEQDTHLPHNGINEEHQHKQFKFHNSEYYQEETQAPINTYNALGVNVPSGVNKQVTQSMATVTHVWSVQNFSNVPGNRITSMPFGFDNWQWVLILCPNGIGQGKGSYLSAFLRPIKSANDIKMGRNWRRSLSKFQLKIRGNGKSSAIHDIDYVVTAISHPNFKEFSETNDGWGFPNLMPVESIGDAIQQDGSIVVELTIYGECNSEWSVSNTFWNIGFEISDLLKAVEDERRADKYECDFSLISAKSSAFGPPEFPWFIQLVPEINDGEEVYSITVYIGRHTPNDDHVINWPRFIASVAIKVYLDLSNGERETIASKFLSGGIILSDESPLCGWIGLINLNEIKDLVKRGGYTSKIPITIYTEIIWKQVSGMEKIYSEHVEGMVTKLINSENSLREDLSNKKKEHEQVERRLRHTLDSQAKDVLISREKEEAIEENDVDVYKKKLEDAHKRVAILEEHIYALEDLKNDFARYRGGIEAIKTTIDKYFLDNKEVSPPNTGRGKYAIYTLRQENKLTSVKLAGAMSEISQLRTTIEELRKKKDNSSMDTSGERWIISHNPKNNQEEVDDKTPATTVNSVRRDVLYARGLLLEVENSISKSKKLQAKDLANFFAKISIIQAEVEVARTSLICLASDILEKAEEISTDTESDNLMNTIQWLQDEIEDVRSLVCSLFNNVNEINKNSAFYKDFFKTVKSNIDNAIYYEFDNLSHIYYNPNFNNCGSINEGYSPSLRQRTRKNAYAKDAHSMFEGKERNAIEYANKVYRNDGENQYRDLEFPQGNLDIINSSAHTFDKDRLNIQKNSAESKNSSTVIYTPLDNRKFGIAQSHNYEDTFVDETPNNMQEIPPNNQYSNSTARDVLFGQNTDARGQNDTQGLPNIDIRGDNSTKPLDRIVRPRRKSSSVSQHPQNNAFLDTLTQNKNLHIKPSPKSPPPPDTDQGKITMPRNSISEKIPSGDSGVPHIVIPDKKVTFSKGEQPKIDELKSHSPFTKLDKPKKKSQYNFFTLLKQFLIVSATYAIYCILFVYCDVNEVKPNHYQYPTVCRKVITPTYKFLSNLLHNSAQFTVSKVRSIGGENAVLNTGMEEKDQMRENYKYDKLPDFPEEEQYSNRGHNIGNAEIPKMSSPSASKTEPEDSYPSQTYSNEINIPELGNTNNSPSHERPSRINREHLKNLDDNPNANINTNKLPHKKIRKMLDAHHMHPGNSELDLITNTPTTGDKIFTDEWPPERSDRQQEVNNNVSSEQFEQQQQFNNDTPKEPPEQQQQIYNEVTNGLPEKRQKLDKDVLSELPGQQQRVNKEIPIDPRELRQQVLNNEVPSDFPENQQKLDNDARNEPPEQQQKVNKEIPIDPLGLQQQILNKDVINGPLERPHTMNNDIPNEAPRQLERPHTVSNDNDVINGPFERPQTVSNDIPNETPRKFERPHTVSNDNDVTNDPLGRPHTMSNDIPSEVSRQLERPHTVSNDIPSEASRQLERPHTVGNDNDVINRPFERPHTMSNDIPSEATRQLQQVENNIPGEQHGQQEQVNVSLPIEVPEKLQQVKNEITNNDNDPNNDNKKQQ